MELRLAYLNKCLVLTCIVFSMVAFLSFREDAVRKACADASWHRQYGEYLGVCG